MAIHKAQSNGIPLCNTWYVRATSSDNDKDVTCKRCLKLMRQESKQGKL